MPPLHNGLPVPVWALLPFTWCWHQALSEHHSCMTCWSLLKKVSKRTAELDCSLSFLSWSLPQAALAITEANVRTWRPRSWETWKLSNGSLLAKTTAPRCAAPSPWAFAAPMNCFNPLTSRKLFSSSPPPSVFFLLLQWDGPTPK